MKPSDMSPYSRPGIDRLDIDFILEFIREVFQLPDYQFLTEKYGGYYTAIPKQVFIACLRDFMNLSNKQIAEKLLISTGSVTYACKKVHETLLNDPEYGEFVKKVYYSCMKIHKAIQANENELRKIGRAKKMVQRVAPLEYPYSEQARTIIERSRSHNSTENRLAIGVPRRAI